MMLLLYVAWVATWQAMYDPRLWTEVASSPSKTARRVNIARPWSGPRTAAAKRRRSNS